MAGFTLLEVMVALAILSIALTAVYRLQSQTISMSAKARFYSLAPQLAQARLAEIQRQNPDDITDGSGNFNETYPGYTWQIQTGRVLTDLLAETPYNLLRIDLTITLNDVDTYALRTYRHYAE